MNSFHLTPISPEVASLLVVLFFVSFTLTPSAIGNHIEDPIFARKVPSANKTILKPLYRTSGSSSDIRRTLSLGGDTGSGIIDLGSSFDDSLFGVHRTNRITRIVVRVGTLQLRVGGSLTVRLLVSGISVTYSNGQTFTHGGEGIDETQFQLHPDEYVWAIAIRSGLYIDQLTFETNLRTFQTIGGSGGGARRFDFGICGLRYIFGRSNSFVNKIGFGYGPPPLLSLRVHKESAFGGSGGKPFDEFKSASRRVTAVRVWHGEFVQAIQVQYDGVWGEKRGDFEGDVSSIFFIPRDDGLVRITGSTGRLVGQIRFFLKSGTTSVAYGRDTRGRSFSIQRRGTFINAFYGRSAFYLDKIGVYTVGYARR